MTAAPPLREVIAALVPDGEAWTLDAPDGWGQGRTLYGGMTAALCWSAAARGMPDLPPLRSAHFAFIGPAAGRLVLTPRLLRRGRSAAVVEVVAMGEAGEAARAILTCGAPRVSAVTHDRAPAPKVCAPMDGISMAPPGGLGPAFAQRFDVRKAGGGFPYGGGDPDLLAWARLLDAKDVDPLVAMLAIGDVVAPAAMVVFPTPGVISTMSWSLDIDRLADDAAAWTLISSSSETAADGYSRQAMQAWGEDGRRLWAGRQTVAVFV